MTKRALYIILLALVAASCTEKIKLKLDTTYTRVVVDGNIQSDTGIYQVAITKSADYFSNEPVPRVVNAGVTLSDGVNTFILHETVKGTSGIYATDTGFAGLPGKKYTLHVNLPEAVAGVTSVEASSMLYPVTHLDSIGTVFEPDWGTEGVWMVKLWAQEPGNETNYYLFNLYRNGKLMSDTITKKVVSDDLFYNGSYMNGIDVFYLNNANKWATIYPGDTIMLQMSGITKEYYDFINQVSMSGFNIPFFTGPPANIKGNVSNGGVGFFAAYSNSYAKVVVK
jgi:hypothetical protein